MNVTPKRQARLAVERRLSLEARDPTPFEDAANFWRAIAQAATIVMCVLMLGVLLYLARALLLPVLCAVAVGLTLGPLIGYAQRRGIPAWLTALVDRAGADRGAPTSRSSCWRSRPPSWSAARPSSATRVRGQAAHLRPAARGARRAAERARHRARPTRSARLQSVAPDRGPA